MQRSVAEMNLVFSWPKEELTECFSENDNPVHRSYSPFFKIFFRRELMCTRE